MVTMPAPPEGQLDGPVHRFAVRVYFEDTDAGGIAYHANYLRWFERARSDLLRLLGLDQRLALESGEGAYAITDLTIRYLKPARLGEAVIVESRPLEVRAASWRIENKAFREGELIAEATSRIGFVDPRGRARRQPQHFHSALLSFLAAKNPA